MKRVFLNFWLCLHIEFFRLCHNTDILQDCLEVFAVEVLKMDSFFDVASFGLRVSGFGFRVLGCEF